ncbi:MAG: redox-regulated ATPase YchF [Nanoarchaeota archaeon]|nr:redox-regulated ATPase YchF [Nanoarchaeota archaeon]
MLLGMIGKPSAGKSTFFKAATLANVEIAVYPFTTIKPNHGVGYVKVECIDKELKTQCQPNHGFCINHQRFVPVDLMDVAGLVKGASEGKGLGNQFLDDLRQADAFIHIVDVSGTTDEGGKQTQGYDPCNDILFLEEELDKWYANILNKVWRTFARTVESSHSKFSESIAKQFSGLKVDEAQVKEVIRKLDYNYEKPASFNDAQIFNFARELRKISKPMIIAANKCDLEHAKENIKKLQRKFPDYMILPCSADSELALREASKAELIDYISGEKDFNLKSGLTDRQKQALTSIKKNVLDVYGNTGVQQVLNFAVFNLLKYIAIFPAGAHKLADSKGKILPDCFLLPSGSTALDFAFYLHTDLGENFITAIDARTKKALGKDYVLKNRDGIEIITR